MSNGRRHPRPRAVGRILLAALGEQGADTPALALLGGGLGLAAALVVHARRRARAARDD